MPTKLIQAAAVTFLLHVIMGLSASNSPQAIPMAVTSNTLTSAEINQVINLPFRLARLDLRQTSDSE